MAIFSILPHTPSRRCIFANRNAYSLLGYSYRKSVRSISFLEFVHGPERGRARREFARLLAGETAYMEKEVLLREVHHRTKNNLQIISSILNMQTEAISDLHAQAVLHDCQSRVHSIALVYEHIDQCGGGGSSALRYRKGYSMRVIDKRNSI